MLWFLMLYGVITLLSGFILYTRCHTLSDYVIGGRKVGTLFSVVSTQISVVGMLFSVQLPMIAAGIYSDGSYLDANDGIITAAFAAAGIITGIFLDYTLVSRRLRIYSELSGQSKTFSEFLENRFDDRIGILRALSAAIIFIFFFLLASSLLGIMADVFALVYGYERETILVVAALFTGIYVFLGGFSAVAAVDLVRTLALLSFSGFIAVSFFDADIFANFGEVLRNGVAAAFSEGFSTVGNVFYCILCFVSFALLFFGIPTVSHRYMAIKDRFKFGAFSVISLSWLPVAAASSIVLGALGMVSAYGETESFAELMLVLSGVMPKSAGIAMVIILFAAVMSFVDSSVLIAASALSNDLFSRGFGKKPKEREFLSVNRITAVCLTLAAAVYAMASGSGEIFSVSFALSVVSAAFGPVTVFGLYFKNLTVKGAVSSVLAGISAVVACRLLDIFTDSLLPFGIIPGFAVGTLFLFAVSAIDKKRVSLKVLNEFGRTREISKMK